jgi:rhodanese-related sulfurtransferase
MTSTALKQSLWQIPVLVILSVLIAFAVNSGRSDGIPLIGDWSEKARFSDNNGNNLVIDLSHAKELFDQGRVIFVDARSEAQFNDGHIRGALNLPWQGVEHYFVDVAERLEGPKTIITYCDGETCELSHELALFLKEMGFGDIRILVNGWTVWHGAGFPVDKGRMAG